MNFDCLGKLNKYFAKSFNGKFSKQIKELLSTKAGVTISLLSLLIVILLLSFLPFGGKSLLGQLFLKPPSKAAKPAGIDLDVTYIDRTPRYYRYCVDYPNDLPTLCKGTENNKRWPDEGESITYTAHVVNKGTLSVPVFTYQWLVNTVVVASGSGIVLSPGEQTSIQYKTTFPSVAQIIQFKVDQDNSISETAETNNSLIIGSHDLTIAIWVEKGLYDIFNETLNLSGSYSFEDWIENQFLKMNERFAQAEYPTSPDGILDQVRIDKIVVADNLDGGSSPMSADPDLYLIDGRWQFTDNDPTNAAGAGGKWQEYVNNFVDKIDWGLIHELAHQLGIIDLYRMNLANDPANNNRVYVTDLNGKQIDYRKLPTIFPNGGLMGGGDTSPYNDGSYFESHTAAGMNAHFNKRRGYYGEYLYDTPTSNNLKILDGLGNPLTGAKVALYQKDPASEAFDNTAEITGTTDSQGVMSLPNRATPSVTTATGHTLRDNPFGKINVVGTNGTMLVKVTKDTNEDYRWLTIHDLNLAYWAGNKTSAAYTIRTNIDTRTFDSTNQALNRPASSNRADSVSNHEPGKAVDQDKTTPGNSWQVYGSINPGDWWQVDLGQALDLGKIVIYPNTQNYGDWCDKAHIDLSTTGSFAGEQKTVVTESNSPNTQNIVYLFPTTLAQFVRIICDVTQNWIQLQEVEVYAVSTSPTPSPSPTPIPIQIGDDTTPPTVSITSPVDGSTVPRNTSLTITAEASDNAGITKVEFRVNGGLKCTDNTTPYSCSWRVPGKPGASYTLEAQAYDAAGNTGVASVRITSQ